MATYDDYGDTVSRVGAPWFQRFATKVSHWTGRPVTFMLAVAIVLVWAVTGPMMGYSEGWQLTINTGTTIITFLMVFIIQSTQNRDTAALHIKLDELIRTTKAAHNSLLNLEELSEEEIEELRERYMQLARSAKEKKGLALEEVEK
jgi:low affinity Fe/Cu permease